MIAVTTANDWELEMQSGWVEATQLQQLFEYRDALVAVCRSESFGVGVSVFLPSD